MGIYVFDSDVLIKALEEDAAKPQSNHDFGKDIIPALIGHGRTYAYPFYDENKKAAKYWRDIGTLDAYYEAQMDLCQVNPGVQHVRSGVAAAHLHAAGAAGEVRLREDWRRGEAQDSLISHGCIVSGSEIRGSILCPNVRVHSFCTDRGFDPDARRARRPARAHPQGDHRPRRGHSRAAR
jgi:glucose-1-phosphate adenylyltransferase